MKAFVINDYLTGTLNATDLPMPLTPRHGEVQLRLLGTSINPIDRLIAKGYGAPLFNPHSIFPIIPGRDGVATIEAIGRGVSDLKIGQRVIVACSPRTGGTYAARFNLPRRCVAPVKDCVPDAVAAAIGYAGMTALQALNAAGLMPENSVGRRLCINGASGGVGSIALLLASHWGAHVTAVASKKNHAWLHSLAPCQTVDYNDPAAMGSIHEDVILNCATPGVSAPDKADPLLSSLLLGRRRPAYATTVTPMLTSVTEKGLFAGLANGLGTYAMRRFGAASNGIRYRWVMFQENPKQLAYLAEFFSMPGAHRVIGGVHEIGDLPSAFADNYLLASSGKTVFLQV